MWANKTAELLEEFRLVLRGRIQLLDVFLPSLLFIVVNAISGFDPAIWSAIGGILIIGAIRAVRRGSLRHLLAGAIGVIASAGLAKILGSAEGYFLPGVITAVLSVLVSSLSVLLKRPIVAWTSYLVRRWPLDWYWHSQVRPAYTEVTLGWTVFFLLRAILQIAYFRQGSVMSLGLIQIITGWPATVFLLVATYLYGLWRLRKLRGPSVEEFISGTKPPWSSQTRGF